jgi:hypothetical protein
MMPASIVPPCSKARQDFFRRHTGLGEQPSTAPTHPVVDMLTEETLWTAPTPSPTTPVDVLPRCTAAELQSAAAQVLEGMEEEAEVVDRALLARLCVVREELEELEREEAQLPGGTGRVGGSVFGAVPATTVAFLKEMLTVGSSAQRWAGGRGKG